ncbi:hypothetical protein FRC12_020850 [Ceratobasidium sp. 428]|nr:hypothetical protein FRC12_020850 [Ceratobasidium sp. 428]
MSRSAARSGARFAGLTLDHVCMKRVSAHACPLQSPPTQLNRAHASAPVPPMPPAHIADAYLEVHTLPPFVCELASSRPSTHIPMPQVCAFAPICHTPVSLPTVLRTALSRWHCRSVDTHLL